MLNNNDKMTNYIFDIEGRHEGDTLVADIIKESANSPSQGVMPPVELGNAVVTKFPAGEFSVSFMHSVRGCRVFLLCSTDSSDKILKLESAIDAARRNSAAEIIAIIPYFAYARQDRKDARKGYQRSSIGSSMMAIKLQALGLHRVILVDVHSEQTTGMFTIPVDHAECSELIAKFIAKEHPQGVGITLMSPDAGGVKRVTKIVDYLQLLRPDLTINIAFCSKERGQENEVKKMTLYGVVENCIVYNIDDMVDTAGTITESSTEASKHGAQSVIIIATHGLFKGKAYERLNDSSVEYVVTTNTLDRVPRTGGGWVEPDRFSLVELSVAGVISQYVRASINS